MKFNSGVKALEDRLKVQGKLVPPFGQCHYCKETTHWAASDCLKLKLAREQPDANQHMDTVSSVDRMITGLQMTTVLAFVNKAGKILYDLIRNVICVILCEKTSFHYYLFVCLY